MEQQIISDAFEDSNAKRTVMHLLACIGAGLFFDLMFDTPFKGFWGIISSIMYMSYIVVLITKYRADKAKAVAYNNKVKENKLEEKEVKIDLMAIALKDKANAIKAKATAYNKMESDLQTLGKERQALTERLQTLGAELARASQSVSNAKESHANAIESLKKSHRNATSSLLTEKEIAEKEANSLRKELERIKQNEEEKALRRSIKNSYSSLKKDNRKMNEKYPNINWEEYI